jgi:methylenetetrahydrofolate--tRNA-(uracil-5-)-methyltransferase
MMSSVSASLSSSAEVAIIGGGLAGTEAAFQLANRGFKVRLHDLKPLKRSPAHHSNHLAEIVCSNSFGSMGASASGLLKEELRRLGSVLIEIATDCAVPAGQALAVDRERFAERVTQRIHQHPNIHFVGGDITDIPQDVRHTLIATGPLTSEGLTATLGTLLNRQNLYFFDAAAPIIAKDSINFETAFIADRYNKNLSQQAEASYINCPLTKEEYDGLVNFINQAERTEMKAFESEALQKTKFFESCMPIEEMARRGAETLRYGPMKPVGLDDPRTGRWPYAVVQLRQDNTEGTLYNMVGFQTNLKWGAQKEMIQRIPGLEQAEVVRYGVMHRNTFLHSPEVLHPTLQMKLHPTIWVAGQLTGTEGYSESVATGLWAGLNIARSLEGKEPLSLPRETMLGALLHYITREEAIGQAFQPINSNWGILPEWSERLKDKKERAARHRTRSLNALETFLSHSPEPIQATH